MVVLNSTPPQGQRTAAWRCRASERDRMRDDARGQHRRSEVGALPLRDGREQGTGREPNCGPQKVFLPPQPPLYVFQAGLVPREGRRKEDRGPNLWKHPTVFPLIHQYHSLKWGWKWDNAILRGQNYGSVNFLLILCSAQNADKLCC